MRIGRTELLRLATLRYTFLERAFYFSIRSRVPKNLDLLFEFRAVLVPQAVNFYDEGDRQGAVFLQAPAGGHVASGPSAGALLQGVAPMDLAKSDWIRKVL